MRLQRIFSVCLSALMLATGSVLGPNIAPQVAQAASPTTSHDVTSRPDKVSASLTARLEHHRVQVTDLDATDSTTYANPDGSFTVEISSAPIRTHGASGLVAIDTHLVASGRDWKVAAADGNARISGGGSGDVASATSGSAAVGIGFGASLPKPAISGDTATYANVVPGVNVVARATEGGFDLGFVLTSRPTGPLTFNLPLDLHGVTAIQGPAGTLHYRNSKGAEAFTTLPPQMYGAAMDPNAHMPTRSEPVATKLLTTSGGPVLQVAPDPAFLADPTVTYPVTIDPSTNIGQSNYDYIDSCCNYMNYNNSLQIQEWSGTYTGIANTGTWNSGSNKERAFFGFSNSSYTGKVVTAATLSLYEFWAYSCSAREVDIWDLNANYGSNLDWANQPNVANKWAAVSAAHGYSSSCGPANINFGVTSLAQHWAALGSGVWDLEARAANESDSYGWKRFKGAATLSVTYDNYPNTPTNSATSPASTCTTGSGRPYMSTTTPTLSVAVSDPDGGTVQGAFEIWHTGGSEIGGQNYSASVASGSTASWAVPAGNFVNGSTYSWRVRGWDGIAYSQNYSPWCEFTIDSTVNPPPSISSTNCPQNAWALSGTSCSFSWSAGTSDVSGYQYQEDSGGWSATMATTTLTWSPAVGQHTLQVQSLNTAGLIGNIASYSFNIGSAGSLTTPADQDRTQASAALSANAPTTYPYADYFYRQGSTATFSQVPASDVTSPGTNNNPSWPVAGDANGNFSPLNWNLANSVRGAGGSDGLIQVEACFYSSSTQSLTSPSVCSPTHNVQLVSHAFGATYATESLGPGAASLLTGDYQVSETDASVPSATGNLSVGRSITTSDPTGELRNLLPSYLHDVEPQGLSSWSSPVQATTTTATSPTILGSSSLQLAPAAGTCTSNCADTYVSVGGDLGGLRLGIKPGHTYTLTAREYVPAGTGLTTDFSTRGERPVFFYQIGTQGYVEFDGVAPTATGSWQLVSLTFTVPDGATEAFVRLYNGFNVGKTSDAVFYDDLTLVADGVQGAEWQTDLPGPAAGASDLKINDQTSQGYVVLSAPDGAEDVYTATSSTSSYPVNYAGQGDANDGSVLSKTSPTQFTLTDADGTVTTWNSLDAGATWQVASVSEPGSSTTTSYTFDADGRVTQVVGPAPVGISCATPLTTAGCRTLTLTYTPMTGAPPTGTSFGNYPGLLQSITFTAADPTNSNAMTQVTVADFAYDANGFLRQAWDPRLSLVTGYGYGPDLRINSVTPPGLNAWSLSYDSAGRLSQVSRADPAGGTDTTTVVYNVPFTGTGAPIEMGSATTSAWGETSDVATYAAAVFNASHVPSGTTPATVSSGDWPYATLHYLDVNGREVNTAAYGAGTWQISTTSHDKSGNTLTQLSPLGRNEALSPSSYPDLDGYVASVPASSDRAGLLSTINTYSSDGTELIDTVGPMHPVVLSTGTTVDARSHTHTTYDEAAPSGGPYRLPTTVTTAAQTPDGVDHDARTSHKGYAPVVSGDTSGWTLRKPTTETTVMGGSTPDIVTTTRYDTQGHVIESRMPANQSGGDAHATVSTYFTATGSGSCVNAGEAGLLCQSGPAAQPTSVPHLLTTSTTYSMWGQPLSVTESDPSCVSSCPTRTTSTVYDAGQRECIRSISTSNVGDTALPAVYTGYDPKTGLVTLTGNISGTAPGTCPAAAPALSSQISTGYDPDGRANSYKDANGNLASLSYTADGLTASLNDGKGTVTYTYDGGNTAEHRRLLTSLADSQAGSFAAAYDANGAMTSETYPNGLVGARHFNDVGQATSLAYALGSTTWLSFSDAYNAQGQIVSQSSSGSSQALGYDNAGRLVSAADTDRTVNPAACTTRTYAYDADSNRQTLTAYPASGTGACSTATTPAVTSHSYDEADRLLVSQGYTYDALGRTTTVPASDAGGTALGNGYYVNDMVASQSQGSVSKSFGLDPSERIATITAGSTIQTNYYANSSDSPAWIGKSDASWTRNVEGTDGNLAAIVSSAGSDELQLTNLHGDVVATAPNSSNATGTDGYFESTEFGIPRTSNALVPRYGWLGGKRRDSGDALAGIVLMGQRLYSPGLGRFLQVDPVPGGSANAYDYANQDPVNGNDLSGKAAYSTCWSRSCQVHTRRSGPFDWGTFSAATFNVGYGSFKMWRGVRAIAVAVYVAPIPFIGIPMAIGLGAYGGYNLVTGAFRLARGIRQFNQVATERTFDTSFRANRTRFLDGISPHFRRLDDFWGGLP